MFGGRGSRGRMNEAFLFDLEQRVSDMTHVSHVQYILVTVSSCNRFGQAPLFHPDQTSLGPVPFVFPPSLHW